MYLNTRAVNQMETVAMSAESDPEPCPFSLAFFHSCQDMSTTSRMGFESWECTRVNISFDLTYNEQAFH